MIDLFRLDMRGQVWTWILFRKNNLILGENDLFFQLTFTLSKSFLVILNEGWREKNYWYLKTLYIWTEKYIKE